MRIQKGKSARRQGLPDARGTQLLQERAKGLLDALLGPPDRTRLWGIAGQKPAAAHRGAEELL